MPIIAPCSRSPSLDGRGRAVLCIVIKECPLSPLSPYLQVPRFATGLFAVLRRALPSLPPSNPPRPPSPSSVFHIPLFHQAVAK